MPKGGRLNIETAGEYLEETSTHQYEGLSPGPYVKLVSYNFV